MQILSNSDVQNLAQELNRSVGARLQEVKLLGGCLCLGFYHGDFFWWVVDINNQAPQFVSLPDLKSVPYKENKKPLSLFLHAHFCDDRLTEVTAPPAYGRVLSLQFKKGGSIELRLFPRGANVIVRRGQTEIALFKPQDLKPLVTQSKEDPVSPRTLTEITQTWLQQFTPAANVGGHSGEKDRQKKIQQITKALGKVEQDLNEKKQQKWSEVGDWLKAQQTLVVPEEFKKFIDFKKSFSSNLENCFRRAKELRGKIQGSEKRRQDLRAQLARLSDDSRAENFSTVKHESTTKSNILSVAEARGRSFALEDGLVLFVGRSAEDNLRLLRKAKPWYLWIHLRDYPGSHGIILARKVGSFQMRSSIRLFTICCCTSSKTKLPSTRVTSFSFLWRSVVTCGPSKATAWGE